VITMTGMRTRGSLLWPLRVVGQRLIPFSGRMTALFVALLASLRLETLWKTSASVVNHPLHRVVLLRIGF